MINAAFLEWIGDNGFVLVAVLGSIAIIIYLWSKFNQREKSR